MSNSIEDLKGAVGGGSGFALPNLFKVILPEIAGIGPRELEVLCKSVVLPGRQIQSQDYQTGTATKKIATGYITSDISLTFYVMNDHKVTRYFDEWQRLAHDPINYTVGYYEGEGGYGKTVTIEQLQKGAGFSLFKKQLGFMDKVPQSIKNHLPDLGFIDLSQGEIDISLGSQSNSVRTIELLQAYPTSVNEIQLGNDQNDQITELSVQLSYKDWYDKGAKGPNSGLGDAIIGGVLGSLLN